MLIKYDDWYINNIEDCVGKTISHVEIEDSVFIIFSDNTFTEINYHKDGFEINSLFCTPYCFRLSNGYGISPKIESLSKHGIGPSIDEIKKMLDDEELDRSKHLANEEYNLYLKLKNKYENSSNAVSDDTLS